MSTYVTIQCDRCYAKLGSGSTRRDARLDAKGFGMQKFRDLDLCTPCFELDAELWGDE